MNRNELIKEFKDELKKVTKNVIIGDTVSKRIAFSLESVKNKEALYKTIVRSIYSNCLFPLVRARLNSGMMVEHIDSRVEENRIYRIIDKENIICYIVVFLWKEVEQGVIIRVQVSRT